MRMTDYEARRLRDRLESLKTDMTDLLIAMELHKMNDSQFRFAQWWEEEGNMRRYFDMKGECERIEAKLYYAQIIETDVPRMLP